MTAITRVSGSIIEAAPLAGSFLFEVVRVGERGLLGEVVRLAGDRASIQVYEETTGLRLGEPVVATGRPLEAELGPGLLGSIIDGLGRPLARLADAQGAFLQPGTSMPTLDRARRWELRPAVAIGDRVSGGDLLGAVAETPTLLHQVSVPPGVAGAIAEIRSGSFAVGEPIALLDDGTALTLEQRWPVRRPRPVARRLPPARPFVTGQRVLDFLFPVAEGGQVAVPGGFGTGKTIIEQSLAKHAVADVVVFVGCGERGNEMAEVVEEFPRLEDPRSGRPLIERTVLVVNTSNMPVVAREASVYLGLTIAEYYRDMGYRVALLVDSLSRWAEALRDLGSRLGDMPGDEGYPPTLSSRTAALYERAGCVAALGQPERSGAVTMVCAISPPGGDLSEPVSQASIRVSGALWALDAALAHQRQFPAVDWQTSYSLDAGEAVAWFQREAGADWPALRAATFELLARAGELREIAALLGADALQDRDRLLLEVAAIAREELLAQNATDPDDASSPPGKTYRLAALVAGLH
ncbi:MAG TPA: V-type ATP synthase subunit A, partial [Kofleriaceae bacterium]|nr:V-type ATP synthase subunit A [Kofleriaceae bacterium]